MNYLILAISFLIGSIPLYCYSYDFYLKSIECKIVVSYLVDNNPQMKVGIGDPLLTRCTRNSKIASCDFVDLSDSSIIPRTAKFEITDIPPYLYLSSNNGADFVGINLTTRHITNITRISDPSFVASKVCTGLYLTEDELKLISKETKK